MNLVTDLKCFTYIGQLLLLVGKNAESGGVEKILTILSIVPVAME